jgi:copper(I)-binding protein
MMKWQNVSQKCHAAGRVSAALLSLGLCAFLLAPQAFAAAPQGVTVEKPWMRFIMAGRPAAGYLTLKNDSDADVVMTGAASPGCGSIMMHQSMEKNGVASMEMVDSITIPAHGSFDFAPGGYHLMCMQTTDALRIGKTVPLTLEFQHGESLTVDAMVQAGNSK